MKTYFIPAKSNLEILLPEENIRQLPPNVGLITNIQHLHRLEGVRQQLQKSGRKVTVLKGHHSKYQGQMYGCDFPADAGNEAVLFIGTGRFHPRGIFQLGKDIFIYDPLNRHFQKMDMGDAERFEKRRKAALMKFLHSTKIGVLVSTKPGQMHNRVVEALKRIYPDKQYYLLVSDTVDFSELANFTFVECYVNTACPRLMEDWEKFDKPVVNIEEVMAGLTPEQKAAKKYPYPLYTRTA
ncbi:diphthamide synthesis protein [Candidatus Woesearchaeota archaeon]|nr:diphthamide synthesis protein [Candidatus Woesearchaeota archaeon]